MLHLCGDHLASFDDADPSIQKAIADRLEERFSADGAVLILDMSGFSLSVRRTGIIDFLSRISRMRRLVEACVPFFDGRVIKFEADNAYLWFPSMAAEDRLDTLRRACEYSIALLRRLHADNRRRGDRGIGVSIGISHGRVILLEDGNRSDYFGDAVNVASKLGEDIAGPFEILVHDGYGATFSKLYGFSAPSDYYVSGLRMAAAKLSVPDDERC